MNEYSPSDWDPSFQDIANFKSLFDQDGLVVQSNRGPVAVLHAYDRSVSINGLDIRQVVDEWSVENAMFHYWWEPSAIRRLGRRPSVFQAGRDARPGMLCIMGGDMESIRTELASAQKVLGLLGMRPLGPKDDITYRQHEFGAAKRSTSFATRVKAKLGMGGDAGVEAVAERDEAFVDGFRWSREMDVPFGASRSLMMIGALARNLGLNEDQPEYAVLESESMLDRIERSEPIDRDFPFDESMDFHRSDVEKAKAGGQDYLAKLRHVVDVCNNGAWGFTPKPYRGDPDECRQMDRKVIDAQLRRLDRVQALIRDDAAVDDVMNAIDVAETGFKKYFVNTDGLVGACETIRHVMHLKAICEAPYKLLQLENDDRFVQRVRESAARLSEEDWRNGGPKRLMEGRETERLLGRVRQGGINDPKALEDRLEAERRTPVDPVGDDEDGPTMH